MTYIPERLTALMEESHRIIRAALTRHATKAVIAFSGGKDALVTAHLLRRYGITEAVCETSLYFTKQTTDVYRCAVHMGLRVAYYNRFPMAWLAAHPEYIFMTDTKLRSTFFKIRQQDTVRRHAEIMDCDVVFFGRRLQENSVKSPLYEKAGVWQCHPLREWRTEDIWSYFATFGLTIPWIYSTAYGRVEGNGPFNILSVTGTRQEAYDVIYGIEPNIIDHMANVGIEEAQAYLSQRGVPRSFSPERPETEKVE